MNFRRTSEKTLGITIKLAVYLALGIVMVILSIKAYHFGEDVFSEEGMDDAPGYDITLVIEEGDGKMDVAKKVVEEGLAKDQYVFYVQSILYEAHFQPGEHVVNSSKSPEEIVAELSKKQENTETKEN